MALQMITVIGYGSLLSPESATFTSKLALARRLFPFSETSTKWMDRLQKQG